MVVSRRGRPTQSEAEQLHQKVRSVAVATFVKHGYDATTMDAIARAAGITRRTLYARYPHKRAVFLDVIPWALSLRTVNDSDGCRDDDDLPSALMRIARGAIARALDPATLGLTRIAMNESPRFPEFAVSAQTMTWSARQREVIELLRHHHEAGAVQVDDFELGAGQFLAMIELLPQRLADFGIFRTKEEEERHLRHAVNLFLRGVLKRD
jgi:TetR/AcrR family transcriptional regulator, mexJK operon transcriptional repressor